MTKLHILTVANKSKYYYPYLIESVKKNNNKLITLGFNKEWNGFNTKYKMMFNKISSFNDNDIICFVDGFDVICVRDLNKLVDVFLEIKQREKCNIIVGFDNVRNILSHIISSLYFTKKFHSIIANSGTYIGLAKDIKAFLSYCLNQDNDDLADDQILMNKYNKLHPGEIYIDNKTEIFLTIIKPLQSIKKYTRIENNIVYSNNNKPFFIHSAGGGFMNEILEELGYNIDYNIEKDILNNHFKKLFIQFSNILYKYKYNILFGFIIFFIVSYIIIKNLLISIIEI